MKRFVLSLLAALLLASGSAFAASIEEGKVLVSNSLSRGESKFFIYGVASKTPSLMFVYKRDGIWQRLSEDEQKSICLFVADEAENLQENPTLFVDVPKSAPFYATALENAKRVCPTCWEVSGPYDSLVIGDGSWQRLEYKPKKDLRFSAVFK